MTEMIENDQMIELIYTDFSKTFHSVSHKRFYMKLKSLGMDANVLGWIKTFLTDIKEFVGGGGFSSQSKKVLSRIPQYYSLILEVKKSFCELFADDSKIHGEKMKQRLFKMI